MTIENGQSLIKGPPKTREEVYAACFSDTARKQLRERFPHLSPDDVDKAVDGVFPLFEQAKITHYIPVFVYRALKESGKSGDGTNTVKTEGLSS